MRYMYKPVKNAIGIVHAIVNVPHDEPGMDNFEPSARITSSPPSALTTTKPSPANAMTTTKRIAIDVTPAANGPSSVRAISASDLPPRRTRCAEHEHVLHRAGQAHADDEPQQAGHVAILNREHRSDQRSRAGDRREVVAKEHPLVGRVIILSVVERMRRRDVLVIEREHLRRQKRGVVAIGNRQDAKHSEDQRHRVHGKNGNRESGNLDSRKR